MTRETLAAFLRRLSENKIVDAATAVNTDNATQAVNAANADNAARVDGLSANEMVRVAFDSTSNAADANGDAVSAFFAVPKDGWLILNDSIDAARVDANNADEYNCSLFVNGATVANTVRASTVDAPGGTHTNNGQENCSTTGVHQVKAGAYTFALTIEFRTSAEFREASV